MPVVELELPRLQKLVGKTNRKKIMETLHQGLVHLRAHNFLNLKKIKSC